MGISLQAKNPMAPLSLFSLLLASTTAAPITAAPTTAPTSDGVVDLPENVPSSEARNAKSRAADVLALTQGILIGFGEEANIDLEQCLIEGPEDIFYEFKSAIDHFEEGSVSSVIIGLSGIGDAADKIISTFQAC